MSETTTGKIAEALAKAQAQMKPAHFDSVNPHFKNKYASLTSIMDAVRGPLGSNGLAISQHLSSKEDGVGCRTVLLHSSGERLESEFWLPVAQKTAQAYGSAGTYARRYSLAAMLGVVADSDDDGEIASAPPPVKQAAPRPRPKPASEMSEGERMEQEEAATSADVVTPAGAYGPTIRFGKNKGKKASQLSEKELSWYIDRAHEAVEDPTKERYREANEKELSALLDVREMHQHGADH